MTYETDYKRDGFVLCSGDEFAWVDQCDFDGLLFSWGDLHEAAIVDTREVAEEIIKEWEKLVSDDRCEARKDEIVIMKAKMHGNYMAWSDDE